MSLLRHDPFTGEWVVIATERGKRPADFKREPRPAPPCSSPTCPFCPGNEASTGTCLHAIPDEKNWRVRVVENKYAALRRAGTTERRERSFFREMDGYGTAEVIIESRRHDTTLGLMGCAEIAEVLRCMKDRYLEAMKDGEIELVTIFKNHGKAAGSSLEHPHSQVISQPIVPRDIRHKIRESIDHYDNTGKCIFCDVMAAERAEGVRIVHESDHFLAFCPFASKRTYETWILPLKHDAAFTSISAEALADLARVLKAVLHSMYMQLDNPDYNLMIHSAPREEDPAAYYHWHVLITPRLTTTAGFEMGSGTYINVVAPEDAARLLSEAVSRACSDPSIVDDL